MYCRSIGIHGDFFLDSLEREGKIKILGAFAMAMRQGRFSGEAYDSLAEATVRAAISQVASTFRDHDRPNPSKDGDGKLG